MSPAQSRAGPGRGVPACPHGRKSMYVSAQHCPIGSSRRRHRWWLSSPWEYWQPGLLASSTDRFRKFFRIGRDRFDDIYRRAALRGKFHLHPHEPMYRELHPDGPLGHGRAQVHKVPPLYLKMAASFRPQVSLSPPWQRNSASANLHFTHSTSSS